MGFPGAAQFFRHRMNRGAADRFEFELLRTTAKPAVIAGILRRAREIAQTLRHVQQFGRLLHTPQHNG